MLFCLHTLHFLGKRVEGAESGDIIWQFGSLAKEVSCLDSELILYKLSQVSNTFTIIRLEIFLVIQLVRHPYNW